MRAWIGAALGVLVWHGVEAQAVRVTVVAEGTIAPVGGAIVSLLATDGTIARRGFSNEAGRLVLRAPKGAKRSGLTFTMASWRRELNEQLDLRFETVDTIETGVSRPFFASAPEELTTHGYINPNDKGSTFFGPDEEVLLSAGFLSTHCFWLNRRSMNDRQQVGLRFEPVRERKLSDIGGTLWVDAATRELREVEYQYRNVPVSVPRDGLVGKVEFAALPEGWWIVSRWNIRMPQVHEVRYMSRALEELGGRRRRIVRGYIDDGGAIVSVKGPPRGQYAIR